MNNNYIVSNISKILAENISKIHYGEATVLCKVHCGRVTSISYSLTEKTIKTVASKENQEEVKND